MKKKFFMMLSIIAVLALLAGCGAQPASEAQTPNEPEEGSASVEQQLSALSGGEYTPLRTFVDENTVGATPELAGEMVQSLILSSITESEKLLEESSEYIYGENSREIQSAIVAAIPEEMVQRSRGVVCAGDKEILMDNLPDGEVKDTLSKFLEAGLCLRNGEGTYFFTVDYPEYWEEYGDKVDPATAEFLKLAAAETRQATLVSEILSVDANELGERAIAYERFLAQYSEFPMADTVRIYFNGTIYKLAYPTVYDRLVDDQGKVITDLMVVYERLAGREDCPVLQGVAQSMLDFIAAQPDGVVADGYDMDALSENASAVTGAAWQMADELYGAISQ